MFSSKMNYSEVLLRAREKTSAFSLQEDFKSLIYFVEKFIIAAKITAVRKVVQHYVVESLPSPTLYQF